MNIEKEIILNGKGKKIRGSMIEITCENEKCDNKKMVRVADIKRGYGRFCSKSCAKR